MVERAQVLVPLFLGARARQYGTDQRVGEHPVERELPGGHAARLGAGLDGLSALEGFGAELALHHALVLAPGAGLGRRRLARRVLAGQHPARQRAVGHDADAVVAAGRQHLDLGHAVHGVVVGLGGHGTVDAQVVAQAHHLGVLPAAEVADPEVARLARGENVADRAQGLLERRGLVGLVQVIDVDVIGAEAIQALIDRAQQPFAAESGLMRVPAHGVAGLGGEHPALPILGDGAPGDLLRDALGIDVRGVDEVDPGLARPRHDPLRGRLVGARPEHHGAETDGGDEQAALAELTGFHGCRSKPLILRGKIKRAAAPRRPARVRPLRCRRDRSGTIP